MEILTFLGASGFRSSCEVDKHMRGCWREGLIKSDSWMTLDLEF